MHNAGCGAFRDLAVGVISTTTAIQPPFISPNPRQSGSGSQAAVDQRLSSPQARLADDWLTRRFQRPPWSDWRLRQRVDLTPL